jgi:transcriptional regulator with GAF, ATPase, and Fis domain/CHASE2 domain-containing sensor protein
MIKNFSVFADKKFLVLLFFLILFGFVTYFQMPWDEPVDDALISLEHKIRGSRSLDSNFVVIYLGDEDIQALGGWPLSRDYYGYLIHVLKSSAAKVIGIDVLFAKPDHTHPEYDNTLSTFIHSAGNVCLPIIFSELIPRENNTNDQAYYGENPTMPLKQLMKYSAAVGFSNFSKSNNTLRAPIIALNGDSTFYSFGAQLAKVFLMPAQSQLPISENLNTDFPAGITRLQLNHFGDIDKVQSIGFVELLRKFRTAPDSLDFNGKLVLFTVTTPGVSTLKTTPLSDGLPASLIHLTVAENLINRNYLTIISSPTQIVLLIFTLFALYLALRSKQDKLFITFGLGLIPLFWIISILFFSIQNIVIPVFYPTLAILSAFLYFFAERNYQKRLTQASMNDLMQKQIQLKESQLQDARKNLDQQEITSDELLQLAENRKYEILKLEKDINDLKIYSAEDKNKSEISANFKDIIFAKTSPMANVLELVLKVSPNDIPVLIMGDTGTGKEMIARAIHNNSTRKDHPFVAINCGALSETLLESELFGHEKGSFSGAITMRRGRFELANGGSIFLDEISETSPTFQTKLLRILQESTFERLGAEQTLKTNVRIIAATNKNLQEEMENNRFRADLFYRLNGFPIHLPALKDRENDLPLLVQHFLTKHKFIMEISDQAISTLKKYPWPGNVRELENHIRRAAIIVQSEKRNLIQESDFPDEIIKPDSSLTSNLVHKPLEDQILEMLQSMKFSHASISQTAKMLGNRDRGTITEYFRGMCFEYLVNANFDVDHAAHKIAGSDDEQVTTLVKSKINTYLENLATAKQNKSDSIFKGLPKKYHIFLEKVITYLNQQ